MENVKCIVCNRNNYKLFTKLSTNEFNHNSFNLVKCLECSMVYLNPRLSARNIKVYYNNNYRPHNNKSNFHLFLQKINHYWKKSIITGYIKGGCLIDVGSGNYNFINYMKTYGWKVDNYDEYTESTINQLDECNDIAYDAITMWHSIEHIHDLDQILTNLKRIIKPNGLIFIACPNINAIDRFLLKDSWVAYDVPRHLYHFSSFTFKKYMTKHNLTIISKYRMIQDTVFNVLYSKKSNILYKIFTLFISIITVMIINNKSSSFLYVCKKNS